MIEVFENKKCCGCNACINVCPQQCISKRIDNQGFLYPVVDKSLCVNCGLCEKVCPELATPAEMTPITTEGVINTDLPTRMNSSSGGVFSALAEEIISRYGVVYGAAFNEAWRLRHKAVDTKESLYSILGSKYVQSDTGSCYTDIKQKLKDGRWVLFCGTPCQVMGLRLFLRRDYERLVCVDFICHGVPGQSVFECYIEAEVERHHIGSIDNIARINFRDKSDAGWHRFCLALTPDNSDKPIYVRDSAYMRGFGANLYLRPSCYSCSAKGFKSGADIKLADYWRVEAINPELDDNKGTSLVSVLTNKGEALMSQCVGLRRKRVNPDEAYRMQIALFRSMPKTSKSDEFWAADWRKDFIGVVNSICNRSTLSQRAVKTVKTALRSIGLKKIIAIYFKRYR